MTAASAVQPAREAAPQGPGGRALAWAAVVAGLLAAVVRLALIPRSFDLFGDEVIYADLGHSVTHGGFPRLQGPFFLHGPAFFYLEAGWIHLVGWPADVIVRIDQMRALNALLAGATAAVLVLLAARAGSLRAGLVSGLLFALDPFCIRQNDRVLLETAMMLWVLLGYLVLAPLARDRLPRDKVPPDKVPPDKVPPDKVPPDKAPRHAQARAAGAGLLFGAAWLTKDEGALLTVLPLLAAAALGWGPRRSLSLLAAGAATATYAAYVGVVALGGEWSTWWFAKTAGVRRMLGVTQITGFNSRGAPSLVSRLSAEARFFGTSYLLLLVAVPALLVLLRRGQLPRLLALFYLAGAAALGYAVTVGTLEENELYLLFVPSLLILPVAAVLWLRGAPRGQPASPRAGAKAQAGAFTAAVALLACVNLTTCVVWLIQPDNGFQRLRQYLAAHVPAGTTIASVDDSPPLTAGTTFWALADRYRVGPWATPAQRARHQVRYVVIPWMEIGQGYSYLTGAQAHALVRPGRLLFSFDERTYGDLALYEVPPHGQRPASGPGPGGTG
jgi:4-amino-4-deoxy-L-arabinose transferase-like glycosyltransferase